MIVTLINLLHLVLIISLIGSVFIPNIEFKKICFTLLIYILIQYITNYGKCGLTELEYIITGTEYKEGFMYRLIKPVITIPEEYFNKHMYWLHYLWILILGYQLYY